jgi:low temperature requirement protein LtrA
MLVLIWWMYGGYVWLTNAVAPDRATYRLLLLGGMAAFLVVSLAIPHAFEGDGLVFGLGYLAVISVHAWMFTRSQAGGAALAILRVAPFNFVIAGLLVIGGALGGGWEYALWGAAVAVIVPMAIRPLSSDFLISASHFVERHGLVVIVALGESVVAVGIGASGHALTAGLLAVAVLGLALSACLWWVYFGENDDERAREAMSATPIPDRPALALRAFYDWHLLMLLGIIAIAAGLEHAIAHPSAELSGGRAVALSGGAAVFLLGDALFRREMGLAQMRWRLAAAALALATIPLGDAISAIAQLIGLLLALAACLAIEHWATGAGEGRRSPASPLSSGRPER